MKKDTSYSFQSKKGMEVTFEELHIRHINLLIDIKNKELNNWFQLDLIFVKKYIQLFF